ncbi:50S ribosomal protein L1 [Acetomicrobium sp. UBA5826]|uniref:50S ribosomal protein L1 n=1 Tax=Acetomicrobium sp. UBA5826 TaxID=1946039 RepID=UPI00257ACE5C|nr:50S ribosomal protein L1 [Acetomicrobium sp. UBA5826]
MAKRSKRYLAMLEKVDKIKLYGLREALELLAEFPRAKFDETVEVHIRLGVDPRHADQQVRGTVSLPHGTGQEKRVLVIASGEKIKEAEEAGADFVGGEDMVQKIEGGWLDFDAVIATPDMMRVVGRLGRTLGPRGLMPSAKTGTVTFDVGEAVREIKAGRIEFRVDRYGIIHVGIGKMSFTLDMLFDNARTLLRAVLRARPAAVKGQYVRSITIAPTMGVGIKVDPARAQKELVEE